MACEEELNALRQAEYRLAMWRKQHPGVTADPVVTSDDVPAGDGAEPAATKAELLQRLAELTAAVKDKRDAYARCQGRSGTSDTGIESLMRDATGRPLGGGAGPPM